MAPQTVLQALKTIPDPRKRQGRQYPLYGLLAILLVAAMQGERSLRGMWLWAREREGQWLNHAALGLRAERRIPGLAPFWYALSMLSGGEVERALQALLPQEDDLAGDGKPLRGSKRVGEAEAWKGLSLAGTSLKPVYAQKAVEGDELAAALAVLEEFPLVGKVIGADAGILKAPLVKKVVKKRGYIGLIKESQPELQRAMVDWIGANGACPRDWVSVEKGHGRLEQRSLWMQPCGELSAYLQERFAWPGARWCGWSERKRRRLADSKEEKGRNQPVNVDCQCRLSLSVDR